MCEWERIQTAKEDEERREREKEAENRKILAAELRKRASEQKACYRFILSAPQPDANPFFALGTLPNFSAKAEEIVSQRHIHALYGDGGDCLV